MIALYRDWWKLVIIVIVSILSNVILHSFFSPIESANILLGEPSIFVKKNMLISALLVWEVLTFSIFVLIFYFIQDHLSGSKLKKGFFYGLSVGGLYFVGMFEATLLFDNTVLTELLMGLPDLMSFILSGIFLGMLVGTSTKQTQKSNGQSVFVVFILALFYFFGRYFAYSVLNISSTFSAKPAGTFFWTLSLGLWVGFMYYLIQPQIKEKSILFQGLFFGALIFGLNWMMNHLFLFTIIQFDIDLLIRLGVDILFTIIGLCTYMKLTKGKSDLEKTTPSSLRKRPIGI